MPEDTAKTQDIHADHPPREVDTAELRRAALVLARKLGSYGMARAEEIGEELEAGSESLLREGRRMTHDLQGRVGKLEARVEHAVRAHPLSAVAALLGVIGFGLILGLILRRRV